MENEIEQYPPSKTNTPLKYHQVKNHHNNLSSNY